MHLIDDILTPDSSASGRTDRYKPGGAQKSFDKAVVRDYLDESAGTDAAVPSWPDESRRQDPPTSRIEGLHLMTGRGARMIVSAIDWSAWSRRWWTAAFSSTTRARVRKRFIARHQAVRWDGSMTQTHCASE